MAFKHCISFVTDLDSESYQTLFPSICSPPPEVAVLFPSPWTGSILFAAANFGYYRFCIMPDIVSKLCAPPSEVAALFNSNLSRRPFLGQVIYLDLLLCTGFETEHAVLFLCHIFTKRPMTDCNIERSYGRCFGRQQLLANSIENFISYEEKVIRRCPISTKH